MSTVTPTLPSRALRESPPLRRTFRGLLRSEWIKLRSMRSTYVLLGLSAVSIIAMALTVGDTGSSTIGSATAGALAAQFPVLLLGVFVVAREFRTGAIRTTFAADPGRARVIAAKAVVTGALTWFVVFEAAIVAFIALEVVHGRFLTALGDLLSDWNLLVAAGAGLALGLLATVAVAFTAALRRTGPAIVGLLVLLVGLPGISVVLPLQWLRDAVSFLPAGAASAIWSTPGAAGAMASPFAGTAVLQPGLAVGVLVLWTAALSVAGIAVLRRSDV